MNAPTTSADITLRRIADSTPQDWGQLHRYLAERGISLTVDPPPRQFAGGFANLNYLVIIDGREAVLRRPPIGPLLPGAHDMGRESRILAQLWQQFPLAPRAFHLCEDPQVLGAPFQLIEFRRGISVRARLPPPLASDAEVGRRLGAMLVDVLAQLHQVDPASVGLNNLGNPQGFLKRAVEGWSKRAVLANAGWADIRSLTLIEELSDWLRRNIVPEGPVSLLHNDFKLDNVLLDSASLQPVAVLDWDQGTRGDGLFDLATLLSYWTEPSDPPAMHRMAQMPTAQPGFPTREQAAEHYAAITGRNLSDFRFHRVLAQFKTAAIFAQLHSRYRAGDTHDGRYADFGQLAQGLFEFALDIARGHHF